MRAPRRRPTPARPRRGAGPATAARPRSAAGAREPAGPGAAHRSAPHRSAPVRLLAVSVVLLAACSETAPGPVDEPAAAPAPLRVAVVESFAAPAGEIARAFEAATGTAVVLAKGSAERLDQDVRAGADHALLLAADAERPRRLEADGLAVPGTRTTYAVGQLALWSPDPARPAGEAVLRSGDFETLAMPDPAVSPYGQAARQVIEGIAPREGLAERLRLTADPGEALEAAASGAAQLALVAGSHLAVGELAGEGSWWSVPPELHDPIRHQAVLLAPGADDPRARAFLAFLAGPEAQEIAARYGYGVEQALE